MLVQIINSLLLHQKLLKNLANRMVIGWRNCLIMFSIYFYVSVFMCMFWVWGSEE